MPISANRVTQVDVDAAFLGPTWCFPVVQDDDDYLVDPNPIGDEDVALVSAAISINREDEPVKVEFWNRRIAVIPAGTLKAGVRYPMQIAKVFSTGTGANVEVLIWRGESLLNLRPTSY